MKTNFDLTGWNCFSERRNSTSYMSPDKKWMAKFFTEATASIEDELVNEMEVTRKAISIGIKTPKVDDICELSNGKKGIVYEYIEGKRSIARAISEEPDKLDEYIKRFANSAKEFHKKIAPPHKFVSREGDIRYQIASRTLLNDKQKNAAYKLLDETENMFTCIHGDFHTGNWIMTDKDEFAIDLGAISYGNPIYDTSVFYFFMRFMPDIVVEKTFHVKRDLSDKMWPAFAKYYYGIQNENELNELNKKMDKYALVSFFGMFAYNDPEQGPEIRDIINNYYDKVFGL